jgi:hypothetical protein
VSEGRHERDLVVWDVPSAVECGAGFSIKLGLKCSSDCPPRDWCVEIRDQDGGLRAVTEVGDAIWPGSAGLYFCEVTLTAPDAVGLFAWDVAAAATVAEAVDVGAHAANHARLNVRTTPEPDCRVTVHAIDRAKQTPVAGLRVVLHPHRAVTDERGIAELRLPRGQYRVFVSGKDFFPFRRDTQINQDMTIRAELEIDRAPTDAELWS